MGDFEIFGPKSITHYRLPMASRAGLGDRQWRTRGRHYVGAFARSFCCQRPLISALPFGCAYGACGTRQALGGALARHALETMGFETPAFCAGICSPLVSALPFGRRWRSWVFRHLFA